MSRSYAIVGLGHRAYTFLHALLGAHAADGRLVGLCDDNPGRLAHAAAVAANSSVRCRPMRGASSTAWCNRHRLNA